MPVNAPASPSLLETKWNHVFLWVPRLLLTSRSQREPWGKPCGQMDVLAFLTGLPGWPLPSFWIPSCISPQRPDRVTNCPPLPGTEFSQDMGFFCAKSGRLGHCTPGPPGHSVRAFNILLRDIVGIWIGELTELGSQLSLSGLRLHPFTALHLILLLISTANPIARSFISNCGYVEVCRHVLRWGWHQRRND